MTAGVTFPFASDRQGALALAETGDHLDQSIRLILSTGRGERAGRPEFGCDLRSLTFETIDVKVVARIEDEIRRALELWEPRIGVLGLEVEFDASGVDQRSLLLTITYRVRATGLLRTTRHGFGVSAIDTSQPGVRG